MNIDRSSLHRLVWFPRGIVALCAAWLPATVLAEGAPMAAAPTAASEIEEIVITAQRREETLQKASVPIDVVSGDELKNANVLRVTDLSSTVPGLQVGQGAGPTQIYIRGVGDFGSTPINNPAVAANIDGVYVARSQALEGNFFDVARVEVLKGPQGTLYGRNASGGAINIITNRPSFDAVSGYADVEVGNYSMREFQGALNLPLSSSLAMRLAGQAVDRDGYVSPTGGDDDQHQAGRLQVLWRQENVTLLVAGDYAHDGGIGPDFVVLSNNRAGTGSPYASDLSPAAKNYFYAASATQGLCIPGGFFPGYSVAGDCPAAAPYPAPPFPPGAVGPYDSLVAFPSTVPRQDNKFYDAHAELTVDFGPSQLTVLPAHRVAELDNTTFPGSFLYMSRGTSTADSMEVRLGGTSSTLKWVGGLYYFKETYDSTENINAGLVQDNLPVTDQSTRSEAAFGEVTFSLTPTTRLIAGARYTSDNKHLADTLTATPPTIAFLPVSPQGISCFQALPKPCTLESISGNATFNKPTWKLGFEQDLAPDNMLYATASEGFKAGGFNQAASVSNPSTPSQFAPETLTAYELGSKNRFFEQRLQINGELFYWDYQNHQEPHINLDGQDQIAFAYTNAGKATSSGVDLEIELQATKADRLTGNVEYNHAYYNSFTYDVPNNASGGPFARGVGNGFGSTDPMSPLAANTACATSPIASGPLAGGVHVDCSGFQLLHAPTWTGSAGYSHHFNFDAGDSLNLALDAQYSGPRWLAIDFLSAERAPSYVTTNASLTYVSASNHWSVAAFGRNLFNETVETVAFENPFVAGYVVGNVGPPRTYGVRLSARF
ncbi:MAG: TonB-dependent receptor [Steroidobacteraceae bacterium]